MGRKDDRKKKKFNQDIKYDLEGAENTAEVALTLLAVTASILIDSQVEKVFGDTPTKEQYNDGLNSFMCKLEEFYTATTEAHPNYGKEGRFIIDGNILNKVYAALQAHRDDVYFKNNAHKNN